MASSTDDATRTAVLIRCGAAVRVASSVDEAIERLQERRPDVLVSDIGLPREDGYALIRRVRELDATLPAAALTAFARPEDHRRALEAGFHAHVSKPIEPADLAMLVATLAHRSEDSPPAARGGEAHAALG